MTEELCAPNGSFRLYLHAFQAHFYVFDTDLDGPDILKGQLDHFRIIGGTSVVVCLFPRNDTNDSESLPSPMYSTVLWCLNDQCANCHYVYPFVSFLLFFIFILTSLSSLYY